MPTPPRGTGSRKRPAPEPGVVVDVAVPDEETVTLANGVVLGIRPVARGAIKRAVENVGEAGDDWDETAVGALMRERLEVNIRVFLALGTFVLHLPPGFSGPDDQRWIDELETGGVPLDLGTSPMARYREWLESYALSEPTDYRDAFIAVLKRSGGTEPGVLEALQWFTGSAPGAIVNTVGGPRG